jgi:hypothetical protein
MTANQQAISALVATVDAISAFANLSISDIYIKHLIRDN